MQSNHRKIGLALGGGAVLGGAHIGVLRALTEHNIKVQAITGTSIGALAACLFAFGKSWQEIQAITLDLDWLDISGMSVSKYALLTNRKIGNVLKNALGDVDFAASSIPFAIIATDVGKGEKVVLKQGSVIQAVMASTCIPGIFSPIEIDGRLLVDGGIMENVPVPSLRDMGANYIIGVDLNAKSVLQRPDNIADLLINIVNISMKNITRIQTQEADLLITPDLSAFSLFNTRKLPEIMEQGYQEAKRALTEC